jgi:hypothetical protein
LVFSNVYLLYPFSDVQPSTSSTDIEVELKVLKHFDVTLEFGPCTGKLYQFDVTLEFGPCTGKLYQFDVTLEFGP